MVDSFHHVYVSLVYVFLLFKRNNSAREQIRGSNLKGVPGSGRLQRETSEAVQVGDVGGQAVGNGNGHTDRFEPRQGDSRGLDALTGRVGGEGEGSRM